MIVPLETPLTKGWLNGMMTGPVTPAAPLWMCDATTALMPWTYAVKRDRAGSLVEREHDEADPVRVGGTGSLVGSRQLRRVDGDLSRGAGRKKEAESGNDPNTPFHISLLSHRRRADVRRATYGRDWQSAGL